MFFSIICFAFVFLLDQPGELDSSPVDKGSKASMSNPNPLTSHVLDTELGRPAAGVQVILSKQTSNGGWSTLCESLTNSDGRVGNLVSNEEFTKGIYKLHFATGSYFEDRGLKTFYPYIQVVFEIENPHEHFHVPILLSAYGYSTYRGS